MLKISCAICLALFCCGCATTKRARSVETSGFLAEVAPKLRAGGEKEPLLYYRNPGVDWKSYTNILLDPVMLWRGPDSDDKAMPQSDQQRLVDTFQVILYNSLAEEGYAMVEKPAPRTMRVQVAVSKLEKTWTGPAVFAKVVPQARLLDTLQGFATGKPVFAGEASIEAKILDAETGALLAAGADRRVGGKMLNAESFNSWGDVVQIMQFWGKGLCYRLNVLRNENKAVEGGNAEMPAAGESRK